MPSRAAGRKWLLALLLSLQNVAARMLAPVKRSDAMRLLKRFFAEDSPDIISMDIGGTLAKVLLFQPCDAPPPPGEYPALELGEECEHIDLGDEDQRALSVYAPELRGNLHFFVFETRYMGEVSSFIRSIWPKVFAADGWKSDGRKVLAPNHWQSLWKSVAGVDELAAQRVSRPLSLRATGGGAYKHADGLRHAGIELDVEEEMAAIIAGLDFLLKRKSELFTVDMDAIGGWTPLATPAQNAELARKYVNVDVAPQARSQAARPSRAPLGKPDPPHAHRSSGLRWACAALRTFSTYRSDRVSASWRCTAARGATA